MDTTQNDTVDSTDSDDSTDTAIVSITANGDAPVTTETPKEKVAREGGKVRAFRMVEETLASLIAKESEKDQTTALRQSAVTETLTALLGTIQAIHAPKVSRPRDGMLKTLKAYFVGWSADGKTREAFTAKPEGREYAKVTGPYSSRTNAMFVVDSGMTMEDVAALREKLATQQG